MESYYPVGSPEWFEWLNRKSTRLIAIDERGPYDEDDICEAHKNREGDWYLIAEIHEQNFKVYIGPSKEMTAEKICIAVKQLYMLPYQKK